MSSFKEANQAKLSLKMKLSQYACFGSILVSPESDGFGVIVFVDHIDDKVKKLIPQICQGVSVSIEKTK
jgi:hypothetical protein